MENKLAPWGKSLVLNLYQCQHDVLLDTQKIQQYVEEVIRVIHMVAHGPCYVERFGEGLLEGISAMQFIETSSITVHCDEIENRVFIDIFSCKDFDASEATAFSKQFFHAASETHTIIDR